MVFCSDSVEETQQIGARIAQMLRAGDLLTLHGGLGAGKTALVRGIAGALGYEDASSPTFSIVHEYPARIPIFHMDVYRLHDEADLEQIAFEEYEARLGIIMIEWPQRIEKALPKSRLDIMIKAVDENRREITLHPLGEMIERWRDFPAVNAENQINLGEI